MEIYIVRHGKTIWNALNLLQGQTDIELNEEGIMAARILGEKCKDTDFDHVNSSPLSRAYTTASCIVGDRDIPIITDERLIEISFGEMEGTSNDIEKQPYEYYRYFFAEPGRYKAPSGGEEFADVIRRTGEFIEEFITPYAEDNQRIMIVGHGALNAGFMCNLEKRPISDYWGEGLQKNCEATVYRFTNNCWIKA